MVPLYAADIPELKGHVNDYGNMLSPMTAASLEAKLTAFEESDSTQIVILTIPALEGEDIEGYCIRVAEKWKIGQAKKDNGVIFFAARDDKRMRIEVGRGLEGVLTDLKSGRIINNIVRPKFKDGDFDGGFLEGTEAIIQVCRGEFKNDGKTGGKTESPLSPYVIFLFIALYFAIVMSAAFSKLISAGIGAAALPSIIHFAIVPLGIAGLVISAVAGLVGAFILPYIPVGGGGRSHSGGSRSSSSFGGGGFSGGGGSFGGGGASGGW
jgi:uncharacterized protein